MNTFIVILVVWVVSGFISYGLQFAYWQRGFELIAEPEYSSDMRSSIFVSLFGPIGLIAFVLFLFDEKVYFKYGFKIR